MADISTKYMGMTLKSPIIVGSCGWTNSVDRIREFEDGGAGAIVLKSIFEEDIAAEYEEVLRQAAPKVYNLEQFDYYDQQVREERLNQYLQLIQDSKKAVSIPVMASVNCAYSFDWAFFANRLQAAGADGLELNIFFSPADTSRSCAEKEQLYFDIVAKVLSQVSIPVAVKMSPYFTNLGSMIQKLSNTGVRALVLFNRFYSPDFDLDTMKVVSTHVFSTPGELAMPLRWVALMSKRVSCDLAASTGVHDGQAVIKQLLAGAKAVQVVSALYKNGSGYLRQMTQEVQNWMTRNEYYVIDQFRGMLSQAESSDPAVYERFQFMRHFGGIQ